jgi:serine/threonine-protein kinase
MMRAACRLTIATILFMAVLRAGNVPGWELRGAAPNDFDVAVDREVKHGGNASAAIWAIKKNPAGFGTLRQFFRPDEYLGQRIRFSGWVKAEKVDSADLWMRVEGQAGEMLTFDNRKYRSSGGTFDWKKQDIVLDVPRDAAAIYIGLLITGRGKVWMDDLSIEIVDRKVRSTQLNSERGPANPRTAGLVVDHPALNLDFEQ